jgi:hypothetical protein
MNELRERMEKALEYWRERRNEEFANAGLDVQAVYAMGNFTDLPADCLLAVSYVDAFASVIANMEDLADQPK